jgi:hypothetical protein
MVSLAEDIRLPEAENFHLYLLVGQSNMSGRAAVEKPKPAVNPRVLMLTEVIRAVQSS